MGHTFKWVTHISYVKNDISYLKNENPLNTKINIFYNKMSNKIANKKNKLN